MKPEINWLFVIVVFFSLLGVFVSAVLFISNRSQSFSARILASIIFCISYALFGFGMVISDGLIHYPFFHRTPVFFTACVPALIFIYVRSILKQEYKFERADLLFLLVALLYTARFIPVYMASGSEKLQMVTKALEDKGVFAREEDAWLPGGWSIISRMWYSIGLVAASFVMLSRWKLRLPDQPETGTHNRQIYRWLVYFTVVMSITYLFLVFEFAFQISRYVNFYRLMALTVSATIFFITSYLLLKPEILYGIQGWVRVSVTEADPISAWQPETSPKPTLSLEQGLKYRQIVEDLFRNQKPFIKPGYTIRDLSIETQVPSYQLSAFINQEYGKNFNEFINDHRVDYLRDLVSGSSEYSQYTLEGLGNLAGFKSRTAFIAAVKRRTGKPPSEIFGKKNTETQAGLH
jgi:AraC-like DNA-binding protein